MNVDQYSVSNPLSSVIRKRRFTRYVNATSTFFEGKKRNLIDLPPFSPIFVYYLSKTAMKLVPVDEEPEVVLKGKHGYINQTGKLVIPFVYLCANPFQNGEVS